MLHLFTVFLLSSNVTPHRIPSPPRVRNPVKAMLDSIYVIFKAGEVKDQLRHILHILLDGRLPR